MNLEWLGYLAAVLTTLAFVPQAVTTIRGRDASGISLGMYVVFIVGIVCWFCYGIVLGSWPIILANAVTFVLSAVILVLKLRHVFRGARGHGCRGPACRHILPNQASKSRRSLAPAPSSLHYK